eukprot:2178124-Amphidinium_carterae.1
MIPNCSQQLVLQSSALLLQIFRQCAHSGLQLNTAILVDGQLTGELLVRTFATKHRPLQQ